VSAALQVGTGDAALQEGSGRLAAVELWNYIWQELFRELPAANICLKSLESLIFLSNDDGTESIR
jgi:hypothetical protein